MADEEHRLSKYDFKSKKAVELIKWYDKHRTENFKGVNREQLLAKTKEAQRVALGMRTQLIKYIKNTDDVPKVLRKDSALYKRTFKLSEQRSVGTLVKDLIFLMNFISAKTSTAKGAEFDRQNFYNRLEKTGREFTPYEQDLFWKANQYGEDNYGDIYFSKKYDAIRQGLYDYIINKKGSTGKPVKGIHSDFIDEKTMKEDFNKLKTMIDTYANREYERAQREYDKSMSKAKRRFDELDYGDNE